MSNPCSCCINREYTLSLSVMNKQRCFWSGVWNKDWLVTITDGLDHKGRAGSLLLDRRRFYLVSKKLISARMEWDMQTPIMKMQWTAAVLISSGTFSTMSIMLTLLHPLVQQFRSFATITHLSYRCDNWGWFESSLSTFPPRVGLTRRLEHPTASFSVSLDHTSSSTSKRIGYQRLLLYINTRMAVD